MRAPGEGKTMSAHSLVGHCTPRLSKLKSLSRFKNSGAYADIKYAKNDKDALTSFSYSLNNSHTALIGSGHYTIKQLGKFDSKVGQEGID